MNAPPIKLFRPGTFTSVEGKQLTFSEADMAAIAAAYDPVTDPAPLVVGHPKLEDPAWGWVSDLQVVDGVLAAVPEKVEPAFAEAVAAGRYRKVSAQFYDPDHSANPRPGSWYLKHVGFLGGAAPAVKGLGTVAFAAADGPFATIETTIEETDMSEQDKTAAFAEREAEITRRETAVQERESALTDREQTVSQALHASNVSFAEQLVSETKLAPAGRDILVGLLDHLEATATSTASFGEGNAELKPAAALKKLLTGAQPLISLGEAAPPRDEDEGSVASFAAPPGFEADPARLKIHAKALELQRDHPDLSYLDAIKQAGG